jgi:hypothetical protein
LLPLWRPVPASERAVMRGVMPEGSVITIDPQ